jgi:hypothetical protein
MARFHGEVGYGLSVEDPPGSGVWTHKITEHEYQGDIIRNSIQQTGENQNVNEDVVIANSISIVADQVAVEHFFDIKYVRWAGVLWTVLSVEVRRPRLILTLGKVYNGPTS